MSVSCKYREFYIFADKKADHCVTNHKKLDAPDSYDYGSFIL